MNCGMLRSFNITPETYANRMDLHYIVTVRHTSHSLPQSLYRLLSCFLDHLIDWDAISNSNLTRVFDMISNFTWYQTKRSPPIYLRHLKMGQEQKP